MILGSDGSGKSRLLTAIAEHVLVPPKQARTTTHVRGSVTVSGVALAKWDTHQLQKRVGVLLNDVRTISDYASLMAGCTLEEILEPSLEGRGHLGPKERNSVAVAMKVRLHACHLDV
jgi:ABC-type protease/lipase transport system fused ATPase/permease subunit